MREGGLGDVQHLGRTGEAAVVVDRADRPQVAQFQMHERGSS